LTAEALTVSTGLQKHAGGKAGSPPAGETGRPIAILPELQEPKLRLRTFRMGKVKARGWDEHVRLT
jgi:hypothetical protein